MKNVSSWRKLIVGQNDHNRSVGAGEGGINPDGLWGTWTIYVGKVRGSTRTYSISLALTPGGTR